MKTPAWLKTLIRFFGFDPSCCVCRRPLRGKWARAGIGPKCWAKMERRKKELAGSPKQTEKETVNGN